MAIINNVRARVGRPLQLALSLLVFCPLLAAQEIRLFSEFQRFDPYGTVLQADRDLRPREVLSPAIPRNGHLTFHIVVTAPTGTNYFLYVVSNPAGLLVTKIYREYWADCGDSQCGDWLLPLESPAFGAIPESLTENPGQTTRTYLLDIYAPPDVIPRRVRIEALLKVGIWLVAPLEVRVIEPTVPDTAGLSRISLTAPVEMPSATTAQQQLLRFLNGEPPVLPESLARVRDMIQRNAAEDLMLARAYNKPLPELTWMAFWPFTYPELGSEWYLRVRDFIYRLER